MRAQKKEEGNHIRHMRAHKKEEGNHIRHMRAHKKEEGNHIRHMRSHKKEEGNHIRHMRSHKKEEGNHIRHMRSHKKEEGNHIEHMRIHEEEEVNHIRHMRSHKKEEGSHMRHMRTPEVEEGEKYLKQLIIQWPFSIAPGCSKSCLAKKKKTTIRTLPHTQGTQSLENGAELRYNQNMTGHSSGKTTEIPTYITQRGFDQIKVRWITWICKIVIIFI